MFILTPDTKRNDRESEENISVVRLADPVLHLEEEEKPEIAHFMQERGGDE